MCMGSRAAVSFFLLDWGLPPSATKRVARSCSGRDRIASASGPTRPRRTAPRGRRGFYDDNDEKRKRGGRKNEKGKRGGSGACLPVRKGEGAKGRAPPSAERHDLNGNHKASHSDNGPPPTTPVQPPDAHRQTAGKERIGKKKEKRKRRIDKEESRGKTWTRQRRRRRPRRWPITSG